MDAKKENRDSKRYAKNDNQETVEINNQTESDGARIGVGMRFIR